MLCVLVNHRLRPRARYIKREGSGLFLSFRLQLVRFSVAQYTHLSGLLDRP